MKLYICVLSDVPDFITPTLVAHTMLGAHLKFHLEPSYNNWLNDSFKKCVCRVNRKEFEKIKEIPLVFLGHEIKTLNGEPSCAIPLPVANTELPSVLRFAHLWKPYIPK